MFNQSNTFENHELHKCIEFYMQNNSELHN